MKIIDFRRVGNLVRFYLGDDDCNDYGGDDWNDSPYEHNAGEVRPEYVKGYRDIAFPLEYSVLEPCCGHLNSNWCKDDMKACKVPCIIATKDQDWLHDDDFDYYLGDEKTIKFYFGDKMESSDKLTVWGQDRYSEGVEDALGYVSKFLDEDTIEATRELLGVE